MSMTFLAGILLVAIIFFNFTAVFTAMALPARTRLVLAAIVGLWIGLIAALAAAGIFGGTSRIGPPLFGVALLVPLVSVLVANRASPTFRAALEAVPTSLLVGLHASRVIGVFFLLLAAGGELGGPFPHSAGWGDIVTGLFALPLAFMIARGSAGKGQVLAWNIFGFLDFVAAIFLGMTSVDGRPYQLFGLGAAIGSDAMDHLPWTLIPTVIVPFFLITHVLVFLRLGAWARNAGRMQAA